MSAIHDNKRPVPKTVVDTDEWGPLIFWLFFAVCAFLIIAGSC